MTTELWIIAILFVAVAFYVWGYWDGNSNGIRVMRDEFDEYRAIVAPSGE